MDLRQIAHLGTWPRAIVKQVRKVAHLLDRETKIAAALDERESIQIDSAVVPVPILGAFRLG